MQLDDARQQVHDQQRQSLAAIVSQLAQAEKSKNRLGTTQARIADASEGLVLINALHGQVAAVDSFLVGDALMHGEQYKNALLALGYARQPNADPFYSAEADRETAYISYQLGQVRQARLATAAAKQALRRGADYTAPQIDENVAYTDAYDVEYMVPLDCKVAIQEIAESADRDRRDPTSDNGTIRAMLSYDKRRISRPCHQGGAPPPPPPNGAPERNQTPAP